MLDTDLTGLGEPPRQLPFTIALAALRGRLWWLGWLFFTLGLVGAGGLLDMDEVRWALEDPAQRQPAQGVVSAVEETNFTVNGADVWAVRYTYTAGGAAQAGVGYAEAELPEVGAALEVRVSGADPALSEAVGLRRSQTGAPWWVGFGPGLFAVAGVILLVVASVRGQGRAALLREGRAVHASLRLRESTAVMVNNQQVWNVVFEFADADDRSHRFLFRTRFPWSFAEGEPRWALYWPRDPDRAALALDVAEGLRVDNRGRFTWRSRGPLVHTLLPPLLGAAVGLVFAVLILA